MNKCYSAILLLVLTCLSSMQALAGQKLRVYFIGNSYTYTNNMPKMIADVAASLGDTLEYEEHTPGGSKLQDHWAPPADPCVGKIKTGKWDYVVLQEQSQLPAFGQLGPTHPTYMYATQFTKLIRDSAKCTTPMFYMTWGYKNGDASNCPSILSMCTYESMDSVMRTRYMELSDSFDAAVSPVGAVRRYIRQNAPSIELYQPDGSHPEVAGTYAAACAFYAAFFKKDPSLTTFNSSLTSADATILKNAAKKVVYDSLAKWGLNVYDLTAAYDESIAANKVTFTNKSSLKMKTYSWDFGDGNTSAQKDPVHTYTTNGSYTVKLTSFDANGCSKTRSKNIQIGATGINEVKNAAFAIIPNPATSYITILSGQQVGRFNIRITSAMGQTVYTAAATNNSNIDISTFSSGMYYVVIYDDNAVLHYGKFIKQ